MTGAGGATGISRAGLITGGLGLYILGSGVLEGLERSAFCLSKTLPGASIKRSCLTLKNIYILHFKMLFLSKPFATDNKLKVTYTRKKISQEI